MFFILIIYTSLYWDSASYIQNCFTKIYISWEGTESYFCFVEMNVWDLFLYSQQVHNSIFNWVFSCLKLIPLSFVTKFAPSGLLYLYFPSLHYDWNQRFLITKTKFPCWSLCLNKPIQMVLLQDNHSYILFGLSKFWKYIELSHYLIF